LEFNSLVPRLPRTGPSAVGSVETSGPLYGSAPVARQTSLFDLAVTASDAESASTEAQEGSPTSAPLAVAGEGSATSPSPAAAAEGQDEDSHPSEQRRAEELAAELKQAGSFSLRVVTTKPQAMESRLLGIAFAYGKTAYLDLAEDTAPLQELKQVLQDDTIAKVGHDLKFDLLLLRRHDITLRGIAFDSAIAYFLASTNRTPNLKDVSLQKLNEELTSLPDLTGTGAKAVPLASLPVSQVGETACREADCVRRVAPVLERELKDKTLYQLFLEVELPLVHVLAEMEWNGVGVDTSFLRELAIEMDTRIRQLEKEIYADVGHEFAIGSTQQLANVLFSELHLPGGKRTKTGYSTDASVLEELVDAHPVVQHVLEWRQLGKLKSTYLDALPGLISQTDYRVHTSFSQVTATTGRLSSSDPNLQNIPIRTDLGTRIREAFVPANPDWYLLAADYSQIELRILAHVTQDPNLIEAFVQRQDIHASTAAFVFKTPIDQVTADMRRVAKMVNFGIAYGLSDFGLARGTGMTRAEAGDFIKGYFDTYPGIQHYMQQTRRDAAELGYVATLLNRRRYIPDIHAANFQLRSAAERMAINMPIQGTAADIIKLAMIRLHNEMQHRQVESKMILQVHDELVFEVPPEEMDSMAALVREVMEGALQLAVPLTVELKAGKNWGQMKGLGSRQIGNRQVVDASEALVGA
ncbi:MAG TPA: DNA polymerase I, partial [Chloroflexota bacterium]|nr:DNA polymerase I [Chloroflexota bacterium]